MNSSLHPSPLAARARLCVGPLLLLIVLAACQQAPTPDAGQQTTAWDRVAPQSGVDTSQPVQTGFLIVDGVYNSELMAPLDVFQHTIFHTGELPGMKTFTVAPTLEPITTFEGLVITPDYAISDHPPIDVLVVPSAEGSMSTDLENEELIRWVETTGGAADYVMSLCDGAFVLAAAGLLDDRAVTTFPSDQDEYLRQFPSHDLRRGVSFVHDRNALTSEGGALSYEPAMYLTDLLYGEDVARGVGGGLLIPWPPAEATWRALIVQPRSEESSGPTTGESTR